MDIASLHGVCCQCISDNDCNSWVDVVLIFDESTAVELSSGVVTCSWWDNGGGIISIRGEGGEWFIGDKGVVKAASLSSWRSESFPAPNRKALSSLLCWTTLVDVSASGGVIGFISDSAWWWRLSEDSGRDLGSRSFGNRSFVLLGEQLTEFSMFTLDFIRNFGFRRNLEERLVFSDCELVGLSKIDRLYQYYLGSLSFEQPSYVIQ